MYRYRVIIPIAVLLAICNIHITSAVTHSMKYIVTAVQGLDGFPEHTEVGMVDDQEFVFYNSKLKKVIPKTDWIEKNEGAAYWERETQRNIQTQQVFKSNVGIAMQRFNQTGGIHALQLMYGCELDEDGKTSGYYQFGYDGEDFLSLDKSTLTWTAANPQAVITKHKWESTGAAAQYWKGYLENTCIEWVQKYVGYGRQTLERKVRPEVSLYQKDSSAPVTCHATGFFPKGIVVSWQKDGEDLHGDVELGETVPNEDGTFQTRSTLTVSPADLKGHKYTCTVDHSSLEKKIIKPVTGPGSSLPIIIGVVVAVLVVVIAIAGFMLWKKKSKSGFVPANTSDDGSNSSNNTAPKA
ncbi:hypothetical protein MATL_G00228850 [Megalops atlanticus]|uniref:Ig-like domain-containing protein n=1 Tax=Megalops atlanticus TaxID=7932 RepID=A0A9D3SXV5_MEGAT|nr:hypothetical protein MATL_G00228850 [Megalops atlanticus]